MYTDHEDVETLSVSSERVINARNYLNIPFFIGGLLVDVLQAQVTEWSKFLPQYPAQYESHLKAFHQSLYFYNSPQTFTKRCDVPEALYREIRAKHIGKMQLSMEIVVAEGKQTYYDMHYHEYSYQYISILGEQQGFPEPQRACFHNNGFKRRVLPNMSFIVNRRAYHGFSFDAVDGEVHYLEVSGPPLYHSDYTVDYNFVKPKPRPSF